LPGSIQETTLVDSILRESIDDFVSQIWPVDLSESSQSLLKFVTLQKIVSIRDLGKFKKLSVLFAQEEGFFPFLHLNMKTHQIFHISQFQKNFFCIAVFFIFLEQRGTAV
jgi:hypothetical protein